MRDHDILRIALERAMRSAVGANPIGDRRTEANARSVGLEALVASLPVNVEDVPSIMDLTHGSPTEGSYFFMLDFSVLSGDDILT